MQKNKLRFIVYYLLFVVSYSSAENAGLQTSSYHMVTVPAGAFQMGLSEKQEAFLKQQRWWLARFEHEKPERKVILPEFQIGMYEVTNAQYNLYASTHNLSLKQAPDMFPVVEVSWYEAQSFCEWLGLRLPTEAEWEKAARGSDSRIFPWGTEPDGSVVIDSSKANYWENRDRWGNGPLPIGTFPPGRSSSGAFDMAGNVLEWVADWYDEKYYEYAPERNPMGPQEGEYRIVRGGAWTDFAFSMRTTMRYRYPPSDKRVSIGFRCAR